MSPDTPQKTENAEERHNLVVSVMCGRKDTHFEGFQ
jgi:hypothetical protein